MKVTQASNQSTSFKGGAVALKGATEKVIKNADYLRRRGILKSGKEADSFEYLCFPPQFYKAEARMTDLLDKAGKLQARTTLGADVRMDYVESILRGQQASISEILKISKK